MLRILLVALVSVSLSAEMLTRTKVAMGTLVSLSVPVAYVRDLQGCFSILDDVEMALSSYNPQAEISKLNRSKMLTDPSLYTLEALKLSQRYYKETDGYFDITIGSITKEIYRFGADEELATQKQLQGAKLGIEGISFGQQELRLQEGITLDLGGMGKGYGVDKLAQHLQKEGVKKAIISLSGDIRCLGICKLFLQDPLQKDGILASFSTLKNESGVSTSGSYERYIKSQTHNHLIDPKTKRSQQNFFSLTLISSINNSDLDAYATAVSVMPLEKAYLLLEDLGVGYIAVQRDLKVIISTNIEDFVRDLEFVQEQGKDKRDQEHIQKERYDFQIYEKPTPPQDQKRAKDL